MPRKPLPDCHPIRRGLATMSAIMLIGFVGVALMAMTAHFGAEMHRTRHAVRDAQIRQWLTFATVEVTGRLNAGAMGRENQVIPLPTPNNATSIAGKVAVTLIQQTDRRMKVRIEARSETRAGSQVVTWIKQDNAWRVESARLNQRQR